MLISDTPKLLKGFVHEDGRGLLSYNNDLYISDFKRIYTIENSPERPFRGWHGHQFESKIFITLRGKIRFGAVRVQDWEEPDRSTIPIFADLEEQQLDAFFVPGGYANGILALRNGSSALVLSSSSLEESENDDFRFPTTMWKV